MITAVASQRSAFRDKVFQRSRGGFLEDPPIAPAWLFRSGSYSGGPASNNPAQQSRGHKGDKLDQRHFRRVIGHFTTGVTLVTSRRADGRPCGLTANALASVSLDPLLILVCLDREAASHGCVIEGGALAVSILEEGHEDLARRFAEGEREERFDEVTWHEAATGSPILDGALAWLDCRVRQVHEGGDHSIIVSEVVACDARDGAPLLYYRGQYHRMPR